MKLRIEEAIKYAKSIGREVSKTDIAEIMYKNDRNNLDTQRANLANYLSNNAIYIKIEWIIGICELCGCPTNLLIGREEKKDFKQSAKPLMDYLRDNYHPHCTAIVNCTDAVIYSGEECYEDKNNVND